MKKIGCILLCAALLCCRPAPAEEKKNDRVIPETLKISIETQASTSDHGNRMWRDSITTVNADVNAALAEQLEQMTDEALPLLDSGDKDLELTANYRISGDSWASFLLVRRISIKRQTLLLDFRCLSYDLATGKTLTLADVIGEEDGWEVLSEALRQTLTEIYPQQKHNDEKISELCQVEKIQAMPFMVGTYQLMLPVALDGIVPETHQIVNAIVFYDQLQPFLTEQATRQLDNSGYAVVALTFDDGPAGASTRQVVDALGHYGATGTFFVIGGQLDAYGEGSRRAADAGHLLGSHTMHHKYSYHIDRDYALRDREQFIAEMQRTTGYTPRVFRAPGGHYQAYLRWQIGWINFHWTYTAADTGNARAKQIAPHVYRNAGDKTIILMHDRVLETAEAMPAMLQGLRDRQFFFATVEELLRMNGVPMEPNKSYKDGKGSMPLE